MDGSGDLEKFLRILRTPKKIIGTHVSEPKCIHIYIHPHAHAYTSIDTIIIFINSNGMGEVLPKGNKGKYGYKL